MAGSWLSRWSSGVARARTCATWGVVIFFAVAGVLVPVANLSAQITVDRPRVGVVPFANLTGTIQTDAVARTTSDTVLLTMRLLGGYEIVEIDPAQARSADLLSRDAVGLDVAAESLDLDNLLFGAVTREADGSFRFELQVYDRGQGAVTVDAVSIADSLFDVFDAADVLVAEAVGGFSGLRIGFASLSVRATGEGAFRLYVDGALIGDNVTAVDRVLIGRREVVVTQIRGPREFAIVEETLTLSEGERRTISFAFPRVTDEEIAREAALTDFITRTAGRAVDPAAVEAAIVELEELYGRLGGEFEPGAARMPWHRARLELARDIEGIAATDFIALARLNPERANRGIQSLIEPWFATIDRFTEEANEPWERAALDRIRLDVRRNLTIVNEFLELSRIGISGSEGRVRRRDAIETDIVESLAAMATYAESLARQGGRRLEPLYNAAGPTRAALDAVARYERADARRAPIWHWLGWLTGAAGVGGAAALTFLDVIPQQEAALSDALLAYNQAVDTYTFANSVDDVALARAGLDSASAGVNGELLLLNTLELAQAGGFVAGGALFALATIGRLTSVGRPERIWNRYLDDPYLEARRAAAIDIRERSWQESAAAILVLGNNRAFDAGTGERALTTPQYIPAQPGQVFDIEILGIRDPDRGRRRVTVRPGLNVVMLEDL